MNWELEYKGETFSSYEQLDLCFKSAMVCGGFLFATVVVVFLSHSFMFEELIMWIHPFSVCFRKDMLFNWTDFLIVLGILGTIAIIIIVILDLCMVSADSSVSVIDQAIPFSAIFAIWFRHFRYHRLIRKDKRVGISPMAFHHET